MKALWRLRYLLRPYWKQVGLSLLVLLALTGLGLVVPTIIRQIIDVGLAAGDRAFLLGAAGLLLGIGLSRAALSYLQRYITEWIATHVGYDLRNQLYDHIQHLPFSFHDNTQAGQLISRCIEDVRSIERFTGNGVVEFVRLGLLLTGIVSLLFLENASLAWIALLPMIPMLLVTINFGSRLGNYFLAVDQALGELSSRLQENVSGVQVVRAFAREDYESRRFANANRTLYNARVRIISQWGRVLPTTNLLIGVGTILILWFGGQMALAGQMTIGEVVAFNSYMLMLATPAQQLTWIVNLAGEAVAGSKRTYDILDLPPEIASPADAVVLPPLSGKVEFQAVDFNYHGESAQALKELTLTAEPNMLVALIGPTGSGKTSLVNLIPRFYDVVSGAVLVDGVDVRRVNLPSLRRQIGIVLQTSLLFSTTVRENIAYGRPEATQAEIEAAARAAQADEFIQDLPNGYETVVGERGVTLSGGQRQRVAIARALLMDPRILILDDSTSSVDTQTERLIQQALDTLMRGRTTFVIAHRLSTVRRADLILVMDKGRIVERGTHLQLLRQGGLYRQIYDLQLRDQERLQEQAPQDTDDEAGKELRAVQRSRGME